MFLREQELASSPTSLFPKFHHANQVLVARRFSSRFSLFLFLRLYDRLQDDEDEEVVFSLQRREGAEDEAEVELWPKSNLEVEICRFCFCTPR